MTTFPINTFFGQIAPELEQLRRQMDELFETGATPTSSRSSQATPTRSTTEQAPTIAAWRPRAAIQDSADSYQLQLQLPGIDVSQIDIEARRDGVTVRGDRKAPTTDAQPIHSEFRYGAFERSFRLSEEIQHQQVSAAYADGILTLTLPKRAAAEDYKVKVQVSTIQNTVGESHAEPEPTAEEVAEAPAIEATTAAPTTTETPESVW